MRIALDTNIIAYAEGVNGEQNREVALRLMAALPRDQVIIPVQVLGELFAVMVRKARRSRAESHQVLLRLGDAFPLAPTTPAVMTTAADLAASHGLGIWDAVILTVAAEADCRLLLSEDLQEGFTVRGVTVTNPFAATRHPMLPALLGDDWWRVAR